MKNEGVAFASESTSAAARTIMGDALRKADPVGARGVENETNWRRNYLGHFRRALEAGIGEAPAAHSIAADGLRSAHQQMRYGAVPLDDAISLREAIEVSNGTLPISSLSAAERASVFGTLSVPAPNTVVFAIPGAGVQMISVTSPLPTITSPLAIEGMSQTGAEYNRVEQRDVFLTNLTVRIDGHALALAQQVLADITPAKISAYIDLSTVSRPGPTQLPVRIDTRTLLYTKTDLLFPATVTVNIFELD